MGLFYSACERRWEGGNGGRWVDHPYSPTKVPLDGERYSVLGRLRAKYEAAVAPVGQALADVGVSPNAMTGTSLVLAVASGYLYALAMAP